MNKKPMGVGDRVLVKGSQRELVLIRKVGRDPLDKRRVLFDAKGLQDRLTTQVNTGEVVKF